MNINYRLVGQIILLILILVCIRLLYISIRDRLIDKATKKLVNESYNTFPEVKIPKVLISSFKCDYDECDCSIKKHLQDWKNINPEYTVKYFSDKDLDNFFDKYPDPQVNKAYKKLTSGAAKADLFRVSYIYLHGGMWFDFDIEPISVNSTLNLDKLLGLDLVCFRMPKEPGSLAYTLFAAKSKTQVLKSVVDNIVYNIMNLPTDSKDKLLLNGLLKDGRMNIVWKTTGPINFKKTIQQHFPDFDGNEGNKIHDNGSEIMIFSDISPKNLKMKVKNYNQMQKLSNSVEYRTSKLL